MPSRPKRAAACVHEAITPTPTTPHTPLPMHTCACNSRWEVWLLVRRQFAPNRHVKPMMSWVSLLPDCAQMPLARVCCPVVVFPKCIGLHACLLVGHEHGRGAWHECTTAMETTSRQCAHGVASTCQACLITCCRNAVRLARVWAPGSTVCEDAGRSTQARSAALPW